MSGLNEQISAFRKVLERKLTPSRYEHSLSVSFTCMALAMRYGYDMHKAELAGLMHDCAKRFTDEDMMAHCMKDNLELTKDELNSPAVIHAKYGAWLAEHKYGITDPEVLSAIAAHTTGKADMGMLDKIVYIADYIEPRRDKAANLPQMRRLAFDDLDETMFAILKSTLDYLNSKGSEINPKTCEAYHYFEKLIIKKGSSLPDEPKEADKPMKNGKKKH